MPPKEAIALRIPADEMAFLKIIAARRGLNPQDYLKRLIHRNFKAHLRRQQREKAPIDASRGGCPVNGHVWFSQGEPTPDLVCRCGAMTYGNGPVPVIIAEERADD